MRKYSDCRRKHVYRLCSDQEKYIYSNSEQIDSIDLKKKATTVTIFCANQAIFLVIFSNLFDSTISALIQCKKIVLPIFFLFKSFEWNENINKPTVIIWQPHVGQPIQLPFE